MLFNLTLYYVLILPAAIVAAIILGFFLRKILIKLPGYTKAMARDYTFLTQLGIVLFGTWSLYLASNDVVVLKGGNAYEEYTFIGSTTLESNGVEYNLKKIGDDDSFIINSTGRLLIYESVEYGTPLTYLPSFGTRHVPGLKPDSVHQTNNLPDYYPWESPPNSVSVPEHSKWDIRYWVRYADPDEIRQFRKQEER